MQKIGCIKDDIEDFTSEADMKIRYITQLKCTEQDMKNKHFSDKQDEMLQKIKTTEGNIMKEIRVHEESVTYFNLVQKELEDTLNSWKLRYTKTMNCFNKKIKVDTDKVDGLITEIRRMRELYAKREGEINDYKVYKQQQEERRQLKKKMDDAATKIQAWWRGTMVRKGYGKYRKRKDKKGKNKNKKKWNLLISRTTIGWSQKHTKNCLIWLLHILRKKHRCISYIERYPNRVLPNSRTFLSIHRRLSERMILSFPCSMLFFKCLCYSNFL
nr:unnamed protein product [Callosobruchus chinensis]